mgnify:CR=1 FL=1
MLPITIQGEVLHLLPEKAIYWPAEHTLILSDLHWGKTAHFRKNGIAIPAHTQYADEAKLSALVKTHHIERLVIAGDMFHSTQNREVDNFSNWRTQHKQLSIDLVLGNHDILEKTIYTSYGIILHEELLDAGPFMFSHDELHTADKFYIHGHIHPSFSISGKGRTSMRLACYCMNDEKMVLPSFGSFTGSHRITASTYRHIYVIAEDEVIQWQ